MALPNLRRLPSNVSIRRDRRPRFRYLPTVPRRVTPDRVIAFLVTDRILGSGAAFSEWCVTRSELLHVAGKVVRHSNFCVAWTRADRGIPKPIVPLCQWQPRSSRLGW